jgi:AhpD family alkylhydroperoxidase
MSLGAQTIDSADPRARPMLEAAKARMGMVPNLYARLANLPVLLATYMEAQDAFRAQGGFTPPEQEVVLLTISRHKGCDYCMAAHSMIAAKLSRVPGDVLEAIRAGDPIPDPKLAALAAFTNAMVDKRGNPSPQDAEAFLLAGYREEHILAIILAIAVKTISNYSNHVFHTPLDGAFAAYEWKAQPLPAR